MRWTDFMNLDFDDFELIKDSTRAIAKLAKNKRNRLQKANSRKNRQELLDTKIHISGLDSGDFLSGEDRNMTNSNKNKNKN